MSNQEKNQTQQQQAILVERLLRPSEADLTFARTDRHRASTHVCDATCAIYLEDEAAEDSDERRWQALTEKERQAEMEADRRQWEARRQANRQLFTRVKK